MEPQPYVPLPGFTVQQSVYVRAYIWSSVNLSMDWRPSLNAAFNEYFGLPLPPLQWPEQATQATQQSTPPAPQEAKKEEVKQQAIAEITAEKQVQKPLYQATVEDVEDDAETAPETTKHGNSMLDNKSTLSTKARLCTAPTSGDPAACPSTLLASSFGSFFGFASFLVSFSASQFGYIECKEGMEASGEG